MWSARKRSFSQDIVLASVLVAVGLTMAGLSLRQMRSGAELAQATPPLQGQPSDDTTNRDNRPSDPDQSAHCNNSPAHSNGAANTSQCNADSNIGCTTYFDWSDRHC